LVLRQYVLQGSSLASAVNLDPNQPPPPAQSIQMAVVVMATVPILLVYPFLQKYFAQGVLTGAIKG
jgi:putative aldouronate transport system permease protein